MEKDKECKSSGGIAKIFVDPLSDFEIYSIMGISPIDWTSSNDWASSNMVELPKEDSENNKDRKFTLTFKH